MKKGQWVKFIGSSSEQVKWGNCDNPSKVLVLGNKYQIEDIDVHSWHTKIKLKGINGAFNSVSFEAVSRREGKHDY